MIYAQVSVIEVLGPDCGLHDIVEISKTYDSSTTSWYVRVEEEALYRVQDVIMPEDYPEEDPDD